MSVELLSTVIRMSVQKQLGVKFRRSDMSTRYIIKTAQSDAITSTYSTITLYNTYVIPITSYLQPLSTKPVRTRLHVTPLTPHNGDWTQSGIFGCSRTIQG